MLRMHGIGSTWIIVVAVFVALPAGSAAQIPDGAIEVGVIGGFHSLGSARSSDRVQAFYLSTEFGHFIRRIHEVGVRIDFLTIGNASPGATIALVYSYNFDTGSGVVPFVGAGFGLGLDTVPAVGPVPGFVDEINRQVSFTAGTRDLIGNSAAIRIEYRYDRVLLDIDDVDRHSLLFGLSLLFGPDVVETDESNTRRPPDVGY